MVFDGRRLWFFHGEENFTATPCRLFYVARERISPIMGVRIFTTLWVWQILHGVVMWSINLNLLSLAEMIERNSYYIYIIKFFFTIFRFVFVYWPRDHTDHTLTKSLCFLWCHHGGRGRWMIGVSPCKCLCYTKNVPLLASAFKGE